MRKDHLITIELLGSYTCLHVESGLLLDRGDRKNRNSPKSALGPLCRLLVDEGYDPEAKVHIIRKALDRNGYIPVFKRDRSLDAWASMDCVETANRSLHVVKHRPLPDAVKGKQRGATTKGSSTANIRSRQIPALAAALSNSNYFTESNPV